MDPDRKRQEAAGARRFPSRRFVLGQQICSGSRAGGSAGLSSAGRYRRTMSTRSPAFSTSSSQPRFRVKSTRRGTSLLPAQASLPMASRAGPPSATGQAASRRGPGNGAFHRRSALFRSATRYSSHLSKVRPAQSRPISTSAPGVRRNAMRSSGASRRDRKVGSGTGPAPRESVKPPAHADKAPDTKHFGEREFLMAALRGGGKPGGQMALELPLSGEIAAGGEARHPGNRSFPYRQTGGFSAAARRERAAAHRLEPVTLGQHQKEVRGRQEKLPPVRHPEFGRVAEGKPVEEVEPAFAAAGRRGCSARAGPERRLAGSGKGNAKRLLDERVLRPGTKAAAREDLRRPLHELLEHRFAGQRHQRPPGDEKGAIRKQEDFGLRPIENRETPSVCAIRHPVSRHRRGPSQRAAADFGDARHQIVVGEHPVAGFESGPRPLRGRHGGGVREADRRAGRGRTRCRGHQHAGDNQKCRFRKRRSGGRKTPRFRSVSPDRRRRMRREGVVSGPDRARLRRRSWC